MEKEISRKDKILIVIFLSLLALLIITPYMFIISYYMTDTIVVFQNKSGKPLEINTIIIEIEHGNSEQKNKATLKNGEQVRYQVKRGMKVLQCIINGKESVEDFDMWQGDLAGFIIKPDYTIEQDFYFEE
jgi:hypothetical protein